MFVACIYIFFSIEDIHSTKKGMPKATDKLSIQSVVLPGVAGSSYVQLGDTRVFCTVIGPTQAMNSTTTTASTSSNPTFSAATVGQLNVSVVAAPFAFPSPINMESDYSHLFSRPGEHGGQEGPWGIADYQELDSFIRPSGGSLLFNSSSNTLSSSSLQATLEGAVIVEEFAGLQYDVVLDIVSMGSSDVRSFGGCIKSALLMAASVALIKAGVPMHDTLAAGSFAVMQVVRPDDESLSADDNTMCVNIDGSTGGLVPAATGNVMTRKICVAVNPSIEQKHKSLVYLTIGAGVHDKTVYYIHSISGGELVDGVSAVALLWALTQVSILCLCDENNLSVIRRAL